MAQHPERDVDPTHELDAVTVFSSSNYDAEMEAMSIQTLLQANGVDARVVGPSVIPSLEFQVQVPRAQADEAVRFIDEARAAGPEAAAQAEASTEQQ